MSILRMLLREIQHRKLNFLSAMVAVMVAVALFVGVITVSDASRRETKRLMRDLGFNLLIVPENTDMADFWSRGYAQEELPEEYVTRLDNLGAMTIRHLVARLQQEIEWRGRNILLTGVIPERRARKGAPMGLNIPRGQAYVGFAIAQSMNVKVGDTISIGDRQLTVARCLPNKGNKDDIRLYAHLHDVQEVLGKPGRINEIEALGCLCFGERQLPRIREDVAKALPDTQVTEFKSIAVARAETRAVMDKYAAFVIPVVFLGSVIWVGLLALGNVRERRGEIGIFRALGVDSGRIAVLFLGKAVIVGLTGAGLGFVLGLGLAQQIGPHIFPFTFSNIAWGSTSWLPLLRWSLAIGPLLCVVASYVPTMLAVAQDPAEVLKEE